MAKLKKQAMDKDLQLHLEFDIQQLLWLRDKLVLYPEVQQKVREMITILDNTLNEYVPKTTTK